MTKPFIAVAGTLACVGSLAFANAPSAADLSGLLADAGAASNLAPRVNERVIAVPGSNKVVRLWDEVTASGWRVPHYAIESASRGVLVSDQARYTIQLNHGDFDPLGPVGELPVHPKLAAGEDNELFIVQFVTRPLEAYTAALETAGADVYKFLAYNSYIVRMDRETREQVAALPFVRWVGAMHPAYKLYPETREELFPMTYGHGAVADAGQGEAQAEVANVIAANANQNGQAGADEARPYNVMVFERGRAMKQRVADRIEAMGGSIQLIFDEGFVFQAVLTATQLERVLAMPEVWTIDPWGAPEHDMNNVLIDGGGAYAHNTLGFRGEGVRAEVMDGNVRESHLDLRSRPVIFHGPRGGDASHGTPCTGIIFGDGTANAQGLGLIPAAQPIFADYESYGGNRYNHTAQLVDPFGTYRGVFQSNSWGGPRTFFYTTDSATMDDILFINDVVITQSQSNAGTQDSRPQAWAKNIVSVGGIYHYDTLTRTDDRWNRGASIGPASDGRIKPDLAYWYDQVFTPGSASDSAYTQFSGTSAATPETAGHFGLFFQMWHEQVFPGFGGGADVFDSRPHMTTSKAIMIHTAEQYAFTGASADLARMKQGWGLANVENLYQMSQKLVIIDESDLIGPFETNRYALDVQQGEPAFRATLVYADPMGVPNSSVHRINDLTLKVTDPVGTVYWGNNGLKDGNWSTPGGSANDRDTVENVFVQNPMAGTWTIEVIADEINEDSHVETSALDADYALVFSPGTPVPPMELTTSAPFRAGQNGFATVTGATPNGNVYLAYSIYGFGSTPVPQLNVELNLDLARLAGSDVADANGTAEFSFPIPNGAGGRMVWMQACEFDRTTNTVVADIVR